MTIKALRRVCELFVLAIFGPLQPGAPDKLIRQLSGPDAAIKVALPSDLGKPAFMHSLLLTTGDNDYTCHERIGLARYTSVRAFLETNCGSMVNSRTWLNSSFSNIGTSPTLK